MNSTYLRTSVRNITLTLCFFGLLPEKTLADEISAAVGMSLAPYIIQQDNSGMEIDIVREALAYHGHTLSLRYPPLKQVPVLYKKNVVDAALTVNEQFGLNACLSDVAIHYQNYAITLKKSAITINSLSDLAGKKVIAFQNAKMYLGPRFSEAVEHAHYSEIKKQANQVNRLFLERDDIAISDKNIFLYYKSKTNKVDTSEPLVFHSIFAPSAYRVAFRDHDICNDFNDGLKQLKATGRYDEIMARYQGSQH